MKRNIFIIQNTEIGGHLALSIFLTNLLGFYNKDKYNLNLICGNIDNEEEIIDIKTKFSIFVLDTGLYKILDNLKFSYKALFILIKENRKQKIDILHCFYPNSSLMGIIIFKLLFNRKVKVIYDVRSPWIEMSFFNNHLSKKKGFIKKLMHFSEYFLISFVDYFVFITDGLKDYYQKQYNLKLNNNFNIIPSGVNVNKFNINLKENEKQILLRELNIKEEELVIGYVGTLSKLRELSKFVKNNISGIRDSNIKFLFIGEGDDKNELMNIIDKNNISKKFIFLGRMKQSNLIKYVQIFDYGLAHIPKLFIFENSFPLKILEYLASGKKILGTDLNAHIEIKKEFENEIIIYKNKVDFSKLKKEKNHNLNKIIYSYDWSNLYNKYEIIYNEMV